MTNCSPAEPLVSPAPGSDIADEGFQFSGEALAHHDEGTRALLLMVQAKDFGVRFVEFAEQVPAVVGNQQFHLDARPREWPR